MWYYPKSLLGKIWKKIGRNYYLLVIKQTIWKDRLSKLPTIYIYDKGRKFTRMIPYSVIPKLIEKVLKFIGIFHSELKTESNNASREKQSL